VHNQVAWAPVARSSF